jgi:peptidyl-prolyl cis-trans isomerase D
MAVVLGLIAISFAIWGIGDIFRGFGRSTVAKIGSIEITVEQFRQLYNDRLQQLGRELRRPITPDQARALRLDEQLINQLVTEATLDQRARQLGLNVSDAEILRQIMADPSFRNLSGQFDPNRFQQILRAAGYTEARFVAEQRRLTLRREVAQSVSTDLNPPKVIADAFNRYDNEQRAIDYVMIDRDKAGDIPAPTPEQLATYFDAHKAQFRAPEYRSIVVLALTTADVAKTIEISDADARRYYDSNKERYGTPERRQVQQIVFPNADEAASAAGRITRQEITFEALAKERGLTDKDIDLGIIAKSAIVDPAIADAAFSLKEGAVSAPVQGRFGPVLVHITKIEPEQVKPFDAMAPEIKQQIANDRAKAELSARYDKIEDERAGGARLSEIAQKLGLTAVTIAAVDRNGHDPAGQPVSGLPSGVNLVANAFSSDVGVENEAVQIPGGGYAWFDVTGVKKERERTLDEVRGEVEQRWRDDQVAERLKAKAMALLDKVKAGTPLNDAATADGLTMKTTFGIKRAGSPGGMAPKVVEAVFRAKKDETASSEGASPTEWVVFRLTDIVVPAYDATTPEAKRIDDAMRRAFTEDLLAQYVARLRTDIGTSINMDALRRVNSPGGDQQN